MMAFDPDRVLLVSEDRDDSVLLEPEAITII